MVTNTKWNSQSCLFRWWQFWWCCCKKHLLICSKTTVEDDLIVADDLSLNSDSSVINMGAGNDVTFTHDGTTGLTIAATPISIDSTGELHLNSTTGDIKITRWWN